MNFYLHNLCVSPGDGNIVPVSVSGRIFCVIYGILGIPLFNVVASSLVSLITGYVNLVPRALTLPLSQGKGPGNEVEGTSAGITLDSIYITPWNGENAALFNSTVWPAVHINPLRKRSFSKTLALRFSVDEKHFELFENIDVTIITWCPVPVFLKHESKRIVEFSNSFGVLWMETFDAFSEWNLRILILLP